MGILSSARESWEAFKNPYFRRNLQSAREVVQGKKELLDRWKKSAAMRLREFTQLMNEAKSSGYTDIADSYKRLRKGVGAWHLDNVRGTPELLADDVARLAKLEKVNRGRKLIKGGLIASPLLVGATVAAPLALRKRRKVDGTAQQA